MGCAHAKPPLHRAANRGDEAQIRLLLSQGAHINERLPDGRTPLHCAAVQPHLVLNPNVEAARALLAAGADKDAKDNNGDTPLHLAAGSCHEAIVRTLLEAGAESTAKNIYGDTPLNKIIFLAYIEGGFGGTAEVAQMLVTAGCEVNARNNINDTPLHECARLGGSTWEVAQVLISAGADLNAKDSQQKTPLLVAQKNHSKEVIRVLVAAGADTEGYTPRLNAAGSAVRAAAKFPFQVLGVAVKVALDDHRQDQIEGILGGG